MSRQSEPPNRHGRWIHPVLAILATWPTVLDPLTRMIGHPDGDVWNHAWGPWWFWHKLSQGELPWRCSELYAPDGGVLWFIDPLGAAAGALLVPILGVAGAWNAVILGSVTLTSWAAASLAREVAGRGAHIYVASAVVVLGPMLNGELHNGISEAALMAPCLFALATGYRALRLGGRRTWLRTGALLGLTFLGSPYYALAAVVVLAVLGVGWLLRRRSTREWLDLLAGAATALAIAAPTALLVRASVSAPDALVHRADPGVVELILRHNAVDPRTFVAPGGFQSVDYAALGEAFVHSGYLGWVALVLAALALYAPGTSSARLRGPLPPLSARGRAWNDSAMPAATPDQQGRKLPRAPVHYFRRGHLGSGRHTLLAVAGAATLVLALGPELFWGGEVVRLGDRAVSLPFAYLSKLVPVQAITHTLRLAVPGLAIVAALAAVGWRQLGPRGRWATAVLLPLDLLVFARPAWPLARTPVLETTVQEALARTAPPEGGPLVLDLPGAVGNTMATSRYLVLQTVHGRPIPYRPDARATTASLLHLPVFQVLALASEVRPEHRDALGPNVRNLRSVEARDLATSGVGVVVVPAVPDPGAPPHPRPQAKRADHNRPPPRVGPSLLPRVGREAIFGDGTVDLS